MKATNITFQLGQFKLALEITHKGRKFPAKYHNRAVRYAMNEAARHGVPYLGIKSQITGSAVSTKDGNVEVFITL